MSSEVIYATFSWFGIEFQPKKYFIERGLCCIKSINGAEILSICKNEHKNRYALLEQITLQKTRKFKF